MFNFLSDSRITSCPTRKAAAEEAVTPGSHPGKKWNRTDHSVALATPNCSRIEYRIVLKSGYNLQTPSNPNIPTLHVSDLKKTVLSRFVKKNTFRNVDPEQCQNCVCIDCRSHIRKRIAVCQVFQCVPTALSGKMNWWNGADSWRQQHLPWNLSQFCFLHQNSSKQWRVFKPASAQWQATNRVYRLSYRASELHTYLLTYLTLRLLMSYIYIYIYKEEDVRSYWMTLRKGEDTLI